MNIFEKFMLDGTNYIGIALVQIIIFELENSLINELKKVKYKEYNKHIKYSGDYAVSVFAAILLMVCGSEYIIRSEMSIWWIALLDFVMLFLYAYFAGKVGLRDSLFTAIISVISLSVAMCFISPEDKRSIMIESITVCFLIFLIVNVVIKGRSYMLSWIEWTALAVSGVLSTLIIGFTLYSIRETGYRIGAFLDIFGAVCNYAILFLLLLKIKKNQINKQEYLKVINNNTLQGQYMESVYIMDEHARKIRHDMKNHINTLSTLLNDSESGLEKAREYLKEYADSTSALQEYVKTKNSVVNAVINAKLMYCIEHDISTSVSVDQNIHSLRDVELCCVLGNILDNAIEAELKNPREDRKIHINITMNEEVMEIFIKNRIIKSVLSDNKHLKTTKKDSNRHGIGIGNVKEIVHKYDGYMDIYEEEDFFCCDIRI